MNLGLFLACFVSFLGVSVGVNLGVTADCRAIFAWSRLVRGRAGRRESDRGTRGEVCPYLYGI